MPVAFGTRIHYTPGFLCLSTESPMSSDRSPVTNVRGWVRVLIAFVVAFDVAAFFQRADGAYQSESGMWAALDSAVPYESHASYHDQMRRVLDVNVRNFWPTHDSTLIRDGEPQGRPLKIYRVILPDSVELP